MMRFGKLYRLIARLLTAISRSTAVICVLMPPGTQVHAAEISASSSENGFALITVVGKLTSSDIDRFNSTIGPYSKGVVAFESDGGSVIAGMSIGESIRLRGFYTFVPSGIRCASSCALAWLGGSKRFMGGTARIGFHAAYDSDTGQTTGVGNALVGAYLNRIGLPYSAVAYITGASPNSMTWLSLADAQSRGIDVSLYELPNSSREPNRSVAPPVAGSDQPKAFEQRAHDFVLSLIQDRSSNNLTSLQAVYADPVVYYGVSKAKAFVLDEKRKFFARWPKRDYKIVPGSETTICSPATRVCESRGTIEWHVYSAERKVAVSGLATFAYYFHEIDNRFVVTNESGKVSSRHSFTLGAGIQNGIGAFLNVYHQAGIAGAVSEVRDCWNQFNIQMTSAKAEMCFSLDYATSVVDYSASQKNNIPENEFTMPTSVVSRGRDALSRLRVPPDRVPALLYAWTEASDQALSAPPAPSDNWSATKR